MAQSHGGNSEVICETHVRPRGLPLDGVVLATGYYIFETRLGGALFSMIGGSGADKADRG